MELSRQMAADRIRRARQLLVAAHVDLTAVQMFTDFGLSPAEIGKAKELALMVDFWGELIDKWHREFTGEFCIGLDGDGI